MLTVVALLMLALIALSDWRRRILPTLPMASLWALGLVMHWSFIALGISALVLTLALLLASVAPHLVAGGDAKLAGSLAALVGPAFVVPMLMIAVVSAGFAAFTLHRGRTVPLGTYLSASAAIALVGGLRWLA